MTRQKIPIKKIDNPTARQVTFSKRRRGLLKKAHELSTLCDAEIAVLGFSATGKLFDYSSSSVRQVIDRHHRTKTHADSYKLDQPSLELQLERSTYALLSLEAAEKTHELRQMKGEELQGLNMEELKKLETSLEGGLKRVLETKAQRFFKEIDALRKKGAQLMQENQSLKQTGKIHVQGHYSDPQTNACCSSTTDPHKSNDSSDTSLKLGLPFPS